MEKLHVLIIDDDRDIANLFGNILSIVGFECEIVYSAREGLSRLILTTPDIVLLDMRLGTEISGDDILYQIRSNPRYKNTRVIVITGYPGMAEPVTDLADLVLLKPVEIDQLRGLVQRVASIEKQPRSIYFRDPVTGLFNQDFFQTRLEHAFARAKRRADFLFAVLVLNLDFQLQSESVASEEELPHVFDNLMREVTARLVKIFRPTDTIARFSRKKLATLHEDLKQSDDMDVIIGRLCAGLWIPYQVDQTTYQLSLNLGSALHSDHFKGPQEILTAAEQALKPLFSE